MSASETPFFNEQGWMWEASSSDLESKLSDYFGVDKIWLLDDRLVYFDGDEEHVIADDVLEYGHGPSGAAAVKKDELPSKETVQSKIKEIEA